MLIKRSPTSAYRICLLAELNSFSSLPIDITIHTPTYTIKIRRTHCRTTFAILNRLKPTVLTWVVRSQDWLYFIDTLVISDWAGISNIPAANMFGIQNWMIARAKVKTKKILMVVLFIIKKKI